MLFGPAILQGQKCVLKQNRENVSFEIAFLKNDGHISDQTQMDAFLKIYYFQDSAVIYQILNCIFINCILKSPFFQTA